MGAIGSAIWQVIDLHCHLLPGIDDGAQDVSVSLAMARMAVADGIEHVACTPHITPGVYENDSAGIAMRTKQLAATLAEEGIALTLWTGADVHVDPQLVEKLSAGTIPTIGQSRYFLFEPPHNVLPPRLPELVRSLIAASFVPVITHPERLRWIESHYDLIGRLAALGALVQLTASSITGGFGRRARYWSERMLDEGVVDLIASDAHNTTGRPPIMSGARDAVIARLGEAKALEMVYNNPARILRNEPMPARTGQIPPQLADMGFRKPTWVKGLMKTLRGRK